MKHLAPMLIAPGDPRGIGPEVTVTALLAGPPDLPVVIIGETEAVEVEARRQGLALERLSGPRQLCARPLGPVSLCAPPPGSEPIEARSIKLAVELCLEGRASALVTGAIHKLRMAQRGFQFTGHTDFLAHLCGVSEPVMAFVGQRMRCALVTTHLPLAAVPAAVTTARVLQVIRVAGEALRRDLGISAPRLVVCGLNPHAGDGGVLGHEDQDIIAPACEQARAAGWGVQGPVSVETAVHWSLTGQADLFIAMYHDQGLAPLKAVEFGHSVNWSLGLPIIRTSVDHGTADDLVGKGVADAGSMLAAIRLAEHIALQRAQRG